MISRTTYREAFKLALSISLYFAFALWMGWDLPADGATAIALISLDTTGATLQKGLARIGGATIGLIVGLVAVALFAQLPMGMLLFFTLYLAFCGYMMLGAHYDYPWVIAAYLPLLVWIKCYLHEGDAFHYATFRYLETIVGVGFYTIVCVVLWPVNEGNRFRSQGSQALQLFQDLFRGFRAELKTGTPPAEGAQQSRQLASTLSQMDASLDRAYKDTPDVYRRRAHWEDMRTGLRALSSSLALWRETIPDVAELNPAAKIAGLQAALDGIEHRLLRLGELWFAGPEDSDAALKDTNLLEPVAIEVDRAALSSLSISDRAALIGFVRQLRDVDASTRQVMRTLRVLQDAESEKDYESPTALTDWFRRLRWRPEHFRAALMAPCCFVVGWTVWYFFNPPVGAENAFMAGIIGLVVARSPMDPRLLLKVFLVVIILFVLPVYVLVLPTMTQGTSLVAVLFLYAFIFRVLGAFSPALQLMPLLLFINLVGISNHQHYSFPAMIAGMTMLTVSISVVIVIYLIVNPTQPTEMFVRTVRRYFNGCADILASSSSQQGDQRNRRRQCFEAAIRPATNQLRAVSTKLESELLPDEDPARIADMISAMDSISACLAAFEVARRRFERHDGTSSVRTREAVHGLQSELSDAFRRWEQLDSSEDLASTQAALAARVKVVEDALDAEELPASPNAEELRSMEDVYASLGCLRSLARAMTAASGTIGEFDWNLLARPRF